jgi:hypothetical protein
MAGDPEYLVEGSGPGAAPSAPFILEDAKIVDLTDAGYSFHGEMVTLPLEPFVRLSE